MKKSILLLLIIIGVSCSNNKKVKFVSSFGNDLKEQFVPSVLIKADMDCRYPIKMEVLDSLLVVQNLGTNELIQLYDKSGCYLSCLVKQGGAPGEVAQLTSTFTADKNKISVYSTPKITEYDPFKFLDKEADYFTTFQLEKTLFDLPVQCIQKHNDSYFLAGFTDKMRFGFLNKDHSMTTYNEYPQIIENVSSEKVAQVMSYTCKTVFSPDKNYWVQGTYIGGTLEVFKKENNQITPVKQIFIYPSIYKDVDPGITWGDETIIGVDDIYATSTYFYVLLNGTTGADLKSKNPVAPFAKKIMVFDWQGNLIKKIETDCMIMTLAVDASDRFCHVISFGDNGYDLRMIQL